DKMMTTAGSLALIGARPPKDSMVVQKLLAAGAVILGKSNLSEWANIRSSHSTSGWRGRGGLTKNPNALGRNGCGSGADCGGGGGARDLGLRWPRISALLPLARKLTVRLCVPRMQTVSSESSQRWDS